MIVDRPSVFIIVKVTKISCNIKGVLKVRLVRNAFLFTYCYFNPLSNFCVSTFQFPNPMSSVFSKKTLESSKEPWPVSKRTMTGFSYMVLSLQTSLTGTTTCCLRNSGSYSEPSNLSLPQTSDLYLGLLTPCGVPLAPFTLYSITDSH